MHSKKTFIAAGLTALWAALILFLSSQEGTETSRLSRSLATRILSLYGSFTDAAAAQLDSFLRKLAHVVLFFGLGGLTAFWSECLKRVSIGVRVAFTTFVCLFASFFDELHKRFIPGRHFSLTESFINLGSSIIGATVIIALFEIIKSRRKRS